MQARVLVTIAIALLAAAASAQDRPRERVPRIRLGTWDRVPERAGLPLPIPGRVVGLLHTAYVESWGGAASAVMQRGAYALGVDRSMPYAVYFPGDRGESTQRPYRATLPDGSPFEIDVASFLRPDLPNDVGLSGIARIVELEVNGGAGSREGHFVATGVRVLDGTPDLPLRADGALRDAQARIDAIVARERRAFDRLRRWGTIVQEVRLVHGTWSTADRTIESVFEWSLMARRDLGREVRETDACPPCPCTPQGECAPCVRCLPDTHRYRLTQDREVTMGIVHVIDATGRVVRETILAPRTEAHDTRDLVETIRAVP